MNDNRAHSKRYEPDDWVQAATIHLLLATAEQAPDLAGPLEKLVEGFRADNDFLRDKARRELEAALARHEGELPRSVKALLVLAGAERASPIGCPAQLTLEWGRNPDSLLSI